MSDDKKHTEHHLLPLSAYYKVFAALIVLTGLTVLTSMFDFGIMNIVIAMIIATAKAFLVALVFMQLKFENLGNRVTFAAAFAFLAIFILLTSSDLFFRHHPEPVRATEGSAQEGETDQMKLIKPTPELVAKGKAIFDVQCVTCHGTQGLGDGIGAAGLNPKPRNFHSGYWRYGGAPTRIFHTLTNGSPGTGMAAYNNLSIETRYALAHYVRTFATNPPPETEADLKEAGLVAGGKPQEVAHQEIPIEMAMDDIEVPDQLNIPSDQPVIHADSLGAKIYEQRCVTCHKTNGMGGTIPFAQGVAPSVAPMTKSWANLNFGSENSFVDVVSNHSPGWGMAGVADLTKEEWSEIFNYSRELAANAH
jgi:caa(3)-type oxidase subunit IV